MVSETGLVYTFTTTKLQPIVTKPEGKNLIQACLNTPDPSMPEVKRKIKYAFLVSHLHNFLSQMNAENKLDDGNYIAQTSNNTGNVSNASPIPVVNRTPEDTSQNVSVCLIVKSGFGINMMPFSNYHLKQLHPKAL